MTALISLYDLPSFVPSMTRNFVLAKKLRTKTHHLRQAFDFEELFWVAWDKATNFLYSEGVIKAHAAAASPFDKRSGI
jgi:hypothetical protein